MASAAILSLEAFRGTQRRVEVRQCLHDHFDRWLDQPEERMKEPWPTLEEPTQAILALGWELTRWATEGLVELIHSVCEVSGHRGNRVDILYRPECFF
jgi:hypothetical protein